ncbi:Haloacid dehalogenase-like hydrolase-domain-containing protein, partial [Colletotrichum phormii]
IPPKTFKRVLESSEWHNLESGKATVSDVYPALTKRFTLEEGALQGTIQLASSTLTLNEPFVVAVRNLKKNSGGQLRVIAATNMSSESYDTVRSKIGGWDIFDDVYTSASLGVRKPEQAFFDRVLKAAGLDTKSTVFVDDRPENFICDQCRGMRGVLFENADVVIQQLNNLFGDPIERETSWLRAHAKNMWCMSNTGIEISEQFQQLLLLHWTNDWGLVDIAQLNPPSGHWNVFSYGPPVLTTEVYPEDLDTTSMALLTLDVDFDVKQKTMDDILKYLSPDGLAYCYFDPGRPRLDPFISANVLRVFYASGRGHQLQPALQFMGDMLRTGAFEHGTRYYHLPDFLLYYLSELCSKYLDANELDSLRDLLCRRLKERMGSTNDASSVGLRLLASNNMRLANGSDRRLLLDLQRSDGNWMGYLYRYGFSGIIIGSEGAITALAVKALQGAHH